jgi:hypothetical protein
MEATLKLSALFLSALFLVASGESGSKAEDWKIVSGLIAKADAKFKEECSTAPCPKSETSSLHLERKAAYAAAREKLEEFEKKWDLDASSEQSLRQDYRLGYLSEKQEDFASAARYYNLCLAHKLIDGDIGVAIAGKPVHVRDLCTQGQGRMRAIASAIVGARLVTSGPLSQAFGGGAERIVISPEHVTEQQKLDLQHILNGLPIK